MLLLSASKLRNFERELPNSLLDVIAQQQSLTAQPRFFRDLRLHLVPCHGHVFVVELDVVFVCIHPLSLSHDEVAPLIGQGSVEQLEFGGGVVLVVVGN